MTQRRPRDETGIKKEPASRFDYYFFLFLLFSKRLIEMGQIIQTKAAVEGEGEGGGG